MTPRLLHALDVLARLVIYDFTVVDIIALHSLEIDDVVLPDLIKTMNVLHDVHDQIRERIPVHVSRWLGDSKWQGEWFEMAEKGYHDKLHEEQRAGFANSTDSLRRTLFYLELSSIAGVSTFVSPVKKDILKFIGNQLLDVFREIESRVDSTMRKSVSEKLGNLYQSFSHSM
jgi:hypothetical protein